MTPSKYAKALFLMLACIYMLPYVQSVCMGVTSVDIASTLKLDTQSIGLLGSSYLYAYALMQLFSGVVAAWLGPRRTLGLLLVLSAGGCVLFSQAHTLGGASAARALTASGMAVVLTSALTIFGRWYPPQAYARLCAWLFAIGGMGSFLGTMPLSFINEMLGWRVAQMIMALLTLTAALGTLAFVRDWPAREKEAEPALVSLRPLLTALRQAAAKPDFWKLCAWYALMSGTFYAFGGLWGGPYLTKVHQLTSSQAGAVLSMGAVGFVVGNPCMTWLCENKLRSYRLGLGFACVLGFVGACLLVFINAGLSLPMLFVTSLLLGIAANAPNAVGYAAARTLFGTRLAGSIGGILGFSSFIGGAVLQNLCGLFLHLAETQGVDTAQSFAIAFALFLPCSLGAAWGAFSLTESFGRRED